MPEIKQITQLNELTSLTPGNSYWIPIVDEAEPVDSNKNKRIAPTNLYAGTDIVLQAVYPVGSIYMSTVATNPATLFGFGTWEAYATGRVIVGIDALQSEFDTVNETGGEKEHTLTENELAPHDHVIPYMDGVGDVWTGGTNAAMVNNAGYSYQTNEAGGGEPHNNLQPYIVSYIWRRTA